MTCCDHALTMVLVLVPKIIKIILAYAHLNSTRLTANAITGFVNQTLVGIAVNYFHLSFLVSRRK